MTATGLRFDLRRIAGRDIFPTAIHVRPAVSGVYACESAAFSSPVPGTQSRMRRSRVFVGIQESFVDYPGRICTMLFTRTCPWNCPGCYNKRSLADASPVGDDQVIDFLGTSRPLTNCVTISGGEPTEDPELPKWVSWLHANGYQVKLDTNGMNPDRLRPLLPMLSAVAMDVKDDPECADRYADLTGGSEGDVENVRRSLRMLSDWHSEDPDGRILVYRTTMFRDTIDTDAIRDYLARNGLSHSEYTVQTDVRDWKGR